VTADEHSTTNDGVYKLLGDGEAMGSNPILLYDLYRF